MAGNRKSGGQHGAFKSKAQWRFAFATRQPWAHTKAVETTGTPVHGTPQGKAAYGRLPRRKSVRKR